MTAQRPGVAGGHGRVSGYGLFRLPAGHYNFIGR
jgi:hypothetical protein